MTTTAPRPEIDLAAARIDVDGLAERLLGRWGDRRRFIRDLATDPRLQRIEGQTMAEHRARIVEQLHILVAADAVQRAFPREVGGHDDHGGSIAGFEELLVADPSLQIKSGVQWGLFASAIMHLGTAEHHRRLLPDILDLTVPGAFAMTEIGHGSDVAAIATTATYDAESEEFVIHTPFRGAWKEFIGNAAVDGVAAVVFAQLVTKGVNHGVHAFYVPLRDTAAEVADGAPLPFLPGVRGEDDGLKGGLNGIDNGRLAFDQVRIPRENLLNRYGDVAADGTYSSPIASSGRRFFTMLGTLVQGRVSLDGSANNAAKMGLAIAVRYGNERRQFTSTSDTEETVLLDYRRHQRRLIPLIAETYAGHFAHETLLDKFDDVFSGTHDDDASRQDLETLAAAFKPLSTWHALHTLQECREACGGAGYMAENRITGLRADLDVYATFEGDNTVLLQLVGRRLLTDRAAELRDIDAGGVLRYVAEKAGDAAMYRTGFARAAQTVADVGDVRRSVNQLRETSVQRELLTDRVQTMVASLGDALRDTSKVSREAAAEKFNDHQHELIEAARAYAELLQWEAFTAALSTIRDDRTREVMTRVRDLFGLTLLERHLSWYLIHGRLSTGRARTVSSYIDRLVARLRPHAQDLVDAWGYGPEHLRATIATGVEAERQAEAADYYRAQRASGDAPVLEKHAKSS